MKGEIDNRHQEEKAVKEEVEGELENVEAHVLLKDEIREVERHPVPEQLPGEPVLCRDARAYEGQGKSGCPYQQQGCFWRRGELWLLKLSQGYLYGRRPPSYISSRLARVKKKTAENPTRNRTHLENRAVSRTFS